MAKEWIEHLIMGVVCVIAFMIGFYSGYVKDKKEVQELFDESKRLHEDALASLDRANQHLADAKKLLNESKELNEQMKTELCGYERISSL